jgi:formylmethanofuran dehydrogenase subunit E
MNDSFKGSLKRVKAISLREPLAETLGVLDETGAVLDYNFTDVVKMAGHACPTVSAAYLCCQLALEKLYDGSIPVRGEIAVTVYGEPDEGVYGVMAQVFSLVTGAATATGFRGLGHKFKRKDLLRFNPKKLDPEAMCFEFRRLDTGQAVLVRFYPQRIPFPEEKAKQLSRLLQPVAWEAASEQEIKQFQELWMEKVEHMLLEREGIEKWLKLEEGRK